MTVTNMHPEDAEVVRDDLRDVSFAEKVAIADELLSGKVVGVYLTDAERADLCRLAAVYTHPADATPEAVLHMAGDAFRIGLRHLVNEETAAVRRTIDRHNALAGSGPREF